MDELFGALCGLTVLGGVIGVFVWWAARLRREHADAIRDLRRRVTALESRANTVGRSETASPATAPGLAVPAVAPVPEKAGEWIETQPVARTEAPATPPLVTTSAAAAPAAPVTEPRPVAERPVPASRAAPQTSFESFVGGRVLLVVGVIVALFGIGFFLKYMIDKGLFVPELRVGAGVLGGAALLFFGDRMRRRGFDVFGHALMGCGLGAVYLSNYFACDRFQFIDRTTGFAFAAALTAAGVALALWRGAPLLAYLGLLGGYLAPALLSTKSGDLVGLTTWLSVIDAGALIVVLARRWRGFECMTLAFSVIYFALWLDKYDGDLPLPTASVFGCVAGRTGVVLVLALLPAIRRREGPDPESIGTAALAGVFCAVAGHELLFPRDRAALAVASGVLGAIYFVSARLVARAGGVVAGHVESLLALTVAALTMSIATAVSGSAVAPSLSVVGVAVVFAGTRTRHAALMAGGVAMIAAAFVDVLANRLGLYEPGTVPFWNERFPVVVSPCIAMLVAGEILRRSKRAPADIAHLCGAGGLLPLALVLAAEMHFKYERRGDPDRELRVVLPALVLAVYALLAARFFGRGTVVGRLFAFAPLVLAGIGGILVVALGHQTPFTPFVSPAFGAGLAVALAACFAAGAAEPVWRRVTSSAGLVYLLALITAEIAWWGQRRELTDLAREDAEFTALVWISVAWAIYAAALVAAGFVRRDAALRWMGIAVFALTLGKVFLFDMARLEAVYRIGSFLALGALLVGASFLYQRAKRNETPPT